MNAEQRLLYWKDFATQFAKDTELKEAPPIPDASDGKVKFIIPPGYGGPNI